MRFGTDATLFALPPQYWPVTTVQVQADLCNGTNGRIRIDTDGTVAVEQEENQPFTNATCFTSLDGVSFTLQSEDAFATFQPLTLENGWLDYTGTAAVRLSGRVVQFRGAVHSGTTDAIFTLPEGLRPALAVYLEVDLCNAHKGQLQINPNGAVSVRSADTFAQAQCFTSLDGVSFVLDPSTTPGLTLNTGWIPQQFATRAPNAEFIAGAVHLSGAAATGGTDPLVFTLRKTLRPAADVYVPVDLCNGYKGRLHIQPNGQAIVEAEGDDFQKAQCFTSLEGVWFTRGGYARAGLRSGWKNGASGANDVSVANLDGVVTMRGGVRGGRNAVLFRLPRALRPPSDVYVETDLCHGHQGRIYVRTDGIASVQTETGTFDDAKCQTSLDGVSFALTTNGFTPMTLQNGWSPAPFGTSAPMATLIDDRIVLLKGAAAGGTDPVLFRLPAKFHPSAEVRVPVTLSDGIKGTLLIGPGGNVSVSAENGTFAFASDFTSLDGVSFDISDTLATVNLKNGWQPAAGARAPRVGNIGGVVHFAGAVAGGGTPVLFTLPPRLRPSKNAYMAVDLCDGAKGRLIVQPDGSVTVVSADGDFGKAQCLTSLDGATFVQ
jgi:hypothetical protein